MAWIRRPHHPPSWQFSSELVAYEDALEQMQTYQQDIYMGEAPEKIWLLEHPPLYTAGTSAKPQDLLTPDRFPLYQTGRGGQYTYHGPGQRIAYVMLDLRQRGQDVRAYISALEKWVQHSLAQLGCQSFTHPDRIGIWVRDRNGEDAKIAAIGVRIRRWITMHGVAINICPDLSHFAGIIPCGISQFGVTSLKDLGYQISLAEFDQLLHKSWSQIF